MMRPLARCAAVIGCSLVVASSAAAEEAAWARERSPEIAAALGRAELQLGLPVPAADHLSFALEKLSDADRRRPEIFFDLVEARRLTMALRISARPGATVLVDGNVVGVAPIERRVFTDGGRHTIRIELDGFAPAQRVVQGQLGDEVEVELGLVPAVAKAAPLAAEPAC
jgi:PEGA domain